jgi:hypothetical protein
VAFPSLISLTNRTCQQSVQDRSANFLAQSVCTRMDVQCEKKFIVANILIGWYFVLTDPMNSLAYWTTRICLLGSLSKMFVSHHLFGWRGSIGDRTVSWSAGHPSCHCSKTCLMASIWWTNTTPMQALVSRCHPFTWQSNIRSRKPCSCHQWWLGDGEGLEACGCWLNFECRYSVIWEGTGARSPFYAPVSGLALFGDCW